MVAILVTDGRETQLTGKCHVMCFMPIYIVEKSNNVGFKKERKTPVM